VVITNIHVQEFFFQIMKLFMCNSTEWKMEHIINVFIACSICLVYSNTLVPGKGVQMGIKVMSDFIISIVLS
jgi:hypothetical protein